MSMESREKQEYDTLYKSLREVLEPASLWFNRMSRFESTAGLTIQDVGGEGSIWKSNRYLVPYTYTHPVFVEMLHERYPNRSILDVRMVKDFTPADIHEWDERIRLRMRPYIQGYIDDDVLSELDNNSDVGVIVHKTGGCVFPFSYSDTKDIMFQIVPEQTILLMARFAAANAKTKEQFDMLNRIVRQYQMSVQSSSEPGYYMYYVPVRKDGVCTDSCGTFTWQDTIPIKDTHDLMKYMRIMFRNHAKCFVVP